MHCYFQIQNRNGFNQDENYYISQKYTLNNRTYLNIVSQHHDFLKNFIHEKKNGYTKLKLIL